MDFSMFDKPINIAIAGATGGIGGALLKACEADQNVSKIYALSRQKVEGNKVMHFAIDYHNPSTFEQLTAIESLDVLIIATGALTQQDSGPEKRIEQVCAKELANLYQINAMGPILLVKALHHAFSKSQRSLIVALSARVGSISDNHLGGWYSYRASKASLNMLFRSYAIEVSRVNKCIATLYHPGTVSTKNFSVYQKHMDPSKIKDPAIAAEELIKHINNISENHSGRLYDYSNEEILF
jgi:NAD(P)-dependent dehydrogenase (short-subunit alcohol dehydrogenase family)